MDFIDQNGFYTKLKYLGGVYLQGDLGFLKYKPHFLTIGLKSESDTHFSKTNTKTIKIDLELTKKNRS